MSDKSQNQTDIPQLPDDSLDRRLFLQSIGKWSGAAIVAAVAGGFLAGAPQARAGAWVNRRGVGGGGWINGGGGGGGAWVNRVGGGGAWINRR